MRAGHARAWRRRRSGVLLLIEPGRRRCGCSAAAVPVHTRGAVRLELPVSPPHDPIAAVSRDRHGRPVERLQRGISRRTTGRCSMADQRDPAVLTRLAPAPIEMSSITTSTAIGAGSLSAAIRSRSRCTPMLAHRLPAAARGLVRRCRPWTAGPFDRRSPRRSIRIASALTPMAIDPRAGIPAGRRIPPMRSSIRRRPRRRRQHGHGGYVADFPRQPHDRDIARQCDVGAGLSGGTALPVFRRARASVRAAAVRSSRGPRGSSGSADWNRGKPLVDRRAEDRGPIAELPPDEPGTGLPAGDRAPPDSSHRCFIGACDVDDRNISAVLAVAPLGDGDGPAGGPRRCVKSPRHAARVAASAPATQRSLAAT